MVGKLLFLFVLQVTLNQHEQALAAVEVTCDAPSTVKGDPAIITCHFPQDVQAEKDNVLVQRLPPGASSVYVRPITVLNCTWTNSGDFVCKAGNGYTLLGEVRTTATILIPRAVDWYEGRYTCAEQDSTACEFQLSEDGHETDFPRTAGPSDSNKPTESPHPRSAVSADSENVTLPLYLLILVTVLVFVVLIILCGMVFVKKTRLRCSRRRSSRQEKTSQMELGGTSQADQSGEPLNQTDTTNNAGSGDQDKKYCFGFCFRSNSKNVHYQNTKDILGVARETREDTATMVRAIQKTAKTTDIYEITKWTVTADRKLAGIQKLQVTQTGVQKIMEETNTHIKEIKIRLKNIESAMNKKPGNGCDCSHCTVHSVR